MKKLLIMMAAAILGFSSCDKEPEKEEQKVTCSITAPEDGAEIDLKDTRSIIISGEGEANTGEISNVTLKINGNSVSEVTALPFDYEYTFADGQATGKFEIELTAEGDMGSTESDKITITLINTEEPPVEQKVTCSITTPAEGTEIKIPATKTITIAGEGTAESGTISKAVLKVGDTTIDEVKNVPFNIEYTIPENQQEGQLEITLDVTGDAGATASDNISISIIREELPDVDENEFLDTRDNKIYKIVTINDQTWFAENLAYLPKVFKSEAANNCNGEQQYFVLNYEGEDVSAAKATEEYKTYGVLYNWYAAMGKDNATGSDGNSIPSGIQGPCPDGWHVPSVGEWKKLEEYVASQLPDVKGNGTYIDLGIGDPYWEYEEGLKNIWSALAALEGWGESSMKQENPDLENGPRNTFGLSLFPSGQSFHVGGFDFSKSTATYWHTELQSFGGGTVSYSVNNYYPDYSKSGIQVERGLPLRCVKD